MRALVAILIPIIFLVCCSTKQRAVNKEKDDADISIYYELMVQSLIKKIAIEEDVPEFDESYFAIRRELIDPIPYGYANPNDAYIPLVTRTKDGGYVVNKDRKKSDVGLKGRYFYNYDFPLKQIDFFPNIRIIEESFNSMSFGKIYKQDSILHSFVKLEFNEAGYKDLNKVLYFEFEEGKTNVEPEIKSLENLLYE